MRETLERELKLVPGDGFRLADLGDPLPPRVFVSTYHDTPDLRLARHGITLRHRAEDGTRLWQLKIPSGAARIELELPGPPARPPGEMTDLLVAYLSGDQPLVRIARLRTRRQSVRKDGAEIVEDSVAVLEAQRVTRRFREVEVELIDGDERTLQRLERALRRAGAQPGVFTPKLYQALDLSFDREPRRIPPDATPGEALGIALAEQHKSLLDHDPGTRLGSDAEDLHQMRVATRRARAFLRAARTLVDPGWAEELRAELGWLGSALGPARDADVLLEHVRGEVEALGARAASAHGLVSSLEERHERARAAAVVALSDERYFALLERLEQAETPPLVAEPSASLADLWWREFGRTRKAFAKLGRRSADAELHAARIRVKRARYSAEVATHELGRPGERFVAAAKRLQDILGEHQDAVVAEEWIRDWAASNPGAEDVAALLIGRERKRRARARRDWPGAWDRLERRARRARE
jgi:CHAD domain-containing protein